MRAAGAELTPWGELDAAVEALEHAERYGTTAERVAAHQEVLRAKEHCGSVGSLLVAMALDHGGYVVQRKLFESVSAGSEATHRAAVRAVRLAKAMHAEMDAMRQEMRELREQLARLTPGVGEPGRTL